MIAWKSVCVDFVVGVIRKMNTWDWILEQREIKANKPWKPKRESWYRQCKCFTSIYQIQVLFKEREG